MEIAGTLLCSRAIQTTSSFETVELLHIFIMYVVESKSFRPDIQKLRQMENAVRDIQCHLW